MARNDGFHELQSGGEGALRFRSDSPIFAPPAGALGDPTGLGIRSAPVRRASATMLGSVQKCSSNECQQQRVNIPRRPRIRSGRSLCSLGSLLNARPFGAIR
jgi:hypothetical protein